MCRGRALPRRNRRVHGLHEHHPWRRQPPCAAAPARPPPWSPCRLVSSVPPPAVVYRSFCVRSAMAPTRPGTASASAMHCSSSVCSIVAPAWTYARLPPLARAGGELTQEISCSRSHAGRCFYACHESRIHMPIMREERRIILARCCCCCSGTWRSSHGTTGQQRSTGLRTSRRWEGMMRNKGGNKMRG